MLLCEFSSFKSGCHSFYQGAQRSCQGSETDLVLRAVPTEMGHKQRNGLNMTFVIESHLLCISKLCNVLTVKLVLRGQVTAHARYRSLVAGFECWHPVPKLLVGVSTARSFTPLCRYLARITSVDLRDFQSYSESCTVDQIAVSTESSIETGRQPEARAIEAIVHPLLRSCGPAFHSASSFLRGILKRQRLFRCAVPDLHA